jgi:uncharacterized membrane protein YheB (UPF0754 family)
MNMQAVDDTLKVFVSRLLEEKQIKDVEPEILEQLKADLMDRVEDRINMVILKNLPEESLGQFEKLLETDNEGEVQAFCQQQIPNLQELIAAELLAFRKTYLDLA